MNSTIIALLLVTWLATGAFSAAHAIMYKRDSRSAALWLLVCAMMPLVGAYAYWALGVNRVERRALRHLGRREREFAAETADPSARSKEAIQEAVGHLTPLRAVSDRITRMPLLTGNALKPLHCGEQAYPRMLEAIEQAQSSITLASYIFDWDDVGRAFTDALGDAARRGVRVHILLDGIGAVLSFSRIGRRLIKSGAEVEAFFPLKFPLGRMRLNLRNHRKILVIDGKLGFTGGMNVSARHYVNSDHRWRCEDLHFELTGPVVAELQHAFVEDWALAADSVLEGEAYFPPIEPAGQAVCRGISSGPDEDFDTIHLVMQAAFAAAEHQVLVVTPYLIPTPALISAMSIAALRGVDIRLILPSVLDEPYMKWAADAYLWQFLERGIRVYRRPPPFVHTKLLIVDDRCTLLGSTNLDRRSFRLQFEFNVEVYDPTLATELGQWLEGLLPECHEVTLAEVDARPWWQRLRDGLVKLLSPYL